MAAAAAATGAGAGFTTVATGGTSTMRTVAGHQRRLQRWHLFIRALTKPQWLHTAPLPLGDGMSGSAVSPWPAVCLTGVVGPAPVGGVVSCKDPIETLVQIWPQ